jgi:acyl carrier protein
MSAQAAAPAPAHPTHFLEALLAWLNGRFARDGVVIGADTPLFTSRLIDSLRILELIAFTERGLDLRIPDSAVRMDNFATPRRIAKVFAAGTGGHDADA